VSWHVTIRSEADADLRSARDWYEQRRDGLGNEYLLAIADAMMTLEESPERHSIYYRDFRRLLVERFPYKIFYRIEGADVIVHRVLHASRSHGRELP
jgi:plasmid stabilization system protein ParE